MNTAQVAEEICQALLKDGVMLVVDGQGGNPRQWIHAGDADVDVKATLQQRESIDIVRAILEAHLR